MSLLNQHIEITECPRDAMQGIESWIPTQKKIEFLNALLKCGFDTLDFGSFVSPKAIPQMKDSAKVLGHLKESKTKLLAIVANARGAEEASNFERVSILGFPYSVSEIFQLRNTNSSSLATLKVLADIARICLIHKKKLRIYISMGFGNPYGEPWSEQLVAQRIYELKSSFDIVEFAISDTIACAQPDSAYKLFNTLFSSFADTKFSAHLHVVPGNENELISSVYNGGCRHFDTALGGFGGCPMAKDQLTGNLSTESLMLFLKNNQITNQINEDRLKEAQKLSMSIFTS